jgi:glycosyltransferase involved in cell wall biosynthesis
MKILVVQDHLRSGGTERQSVLLANSFAVAGHATTLVTFRPGGALSATVGATVLRHSLQRFDLGLDWFAPGLTRIVGDVSPDIVLCMGRMANCYAGTLQRHRPAAAVVATMRTGKSLPFLFRRSLHLVRQIVANSHEARATLTTQHGLPGYKISVIHNSLVFPALPSASNLSSARQALRAQYGAKPSTTVFLNVAMFRPEKNQRELIEIVGGLPRSLDWQLWLAGDGPARAACETLVERKNLSAHIRFVGFHSDPSPLYAAADLAVHASWSEALSNFLIEAQAHGLPAVAYDAQGNRECFVPDCTGWIIARHDRAAFQTALVRLAAEPPATRTVRSTEARVFARTTFDPTRQVAAYLTLFQTLVRHSPP